MSEVLEISSDSNDTIILTNNAEFEEEIAIENAVKKYISDNNLSDNNKYSLESDDESLSAADINAIQKSVEKIGSEDNVLQDLFEKYKCLRDDSDPKTDLQLFFEGVQAQASKKIKIVTDDKGKKKLEKESIRQEKLLERIKKKEEIEREKALKKAVAAANKNLKPEECMKFVTVCLDNQIVLAEYGKDALTVLQEANISYKTDSQIFPSIVTWTRKVDSHSLDDSGKLVTSSENCETDEVLQIINWKDFVDQVNNHELSRHIQRLQTILCNKKISLAIYGLERYFKYHKNLKNKNLRSEVGDNSQKYIKDHKIFENVPKVTRSDVEFALTELQLLTACSYRMIETGQDLGQMVAQFTKSIAQLPYKLKKHEKYLQADSFLAADNKDCVRVDKNGNGLYRLWHQILTTFPLARLETAEAISSKYPTPSDLMEAYERCTAHEGEKLLQDIPIRRAAGPLTSVRKIGPELSKKIYNFFTCLDGDGLL